MPDVVPPAVSRLIQADKGRPQGGAIPASAQATGSAAEGKTVNKPGAKLHPLDKLVATGVLVAEAALRKHGKSPSLFIGFVSEGMFPFTFDEGEDFTEFIRNVKLICRARDVEAGILFYGACFINPLEHRPSRPDPCLRIDVVHLVAESREGQRLEKYLPVIWDAAGKFKGFGEASTAPAYSKLPPFPRLMPERRQTEFEQAQARLALLTKGILMRCDPPAGSAK
jgi:hypothetical protein